MHIAIAGNIGSGKSTLTRLLARHYGWKPHYEQVANNPYLEDYYRDIKRWSFPLEVFYLKERFKDLLQLQKQKEDIVQDRSIYEGVYVFTANNHDLGNLDDRDFETYMELFEDMTDVVRYPDLRVYLRCSVGHLASNIEKRGRSYEEQMPRRRLHHEAIPGAGAHHRGRRARLPGQPVRPRLHHGQDRPRVVRPLPRQIKVWTHPQ